MNVVIEQEIKVKELEGGDIVICSTNDPYLVMKVHGTDKYELRSFNGITGAVGSNYNLSGLSQYVKSKGYVVFSKSEFELVLRKKS